MNVYLFPKYPDNFVLLLFIIFKHHTRETCYLLEKYPTFKRFLLSFLFINKTLRLENLQTRAAMNEEMSMYLI